MATYTIKDKQKKELRNMKKLRYLLFALAALTLAACGSDGNELTEGNIFTEKDKANDLYELVTDVALQWFIPHVAEMPGGWARLEPGAENSS